MRISAMPETEIGLSDGEISIAQRSLMGDHDQTVYFPVELAERIANEILRLAKEHQQGSTS